MVPLRVSIRVTG